MAITPNTIAEKLVSINNSKVDIASAITEKGGTVPQLFSGYGDAIRNLPSSGLELIPVEYIALTYNSTYPNITNGRPITTAPISEIGSFEIKFQDDILTGSTRLALFGARDGSSAYVDTFVIFGGNNGQLRLDVNSTSARYFATGGQICTLTLASSGVITCQTTTTTTFSPQKDIWNPAADVSPVFVIFGQNQTSNNTIQPTPCKLYYCKIWDKSGNLTYDIIPVKINNLGYAYNKVTNTILPGGGYTAFGLEI